jgi:hypothetical protein
MYKIAAAINSAKDFSIECEILMLSRPLQVGHLRPLFVVFFGKVISVWQYRQEISPAFFAVTSLLRINGSSPFSRSNEDQELNLRLPI